MKKLLFGDEVKKLKANGKIKDKMFLKCNYVLQSCSREYIENAGLSYEEVLSSFVGKENAHKILSLEIAKLDGTEDRGISYKGSNMVVTNGTALMDYADNFSGFGDVSDMAFIDFIEGRLDWLINAKLVDYESYCMIDNGKVIACNKMIFQMENEEEKEFVSEKIILGENENLSKLIESNKWHRERWDLDGSPLESMETKKLYYRAE